MSVALWPVFEDGRGHGLVDEGTVLLDVCDELDELAVSAGRTPLTAFDAYADVPEEVVAERAMAAEGIPDLSDLPVTWHEPSDAVATLDALLAAVGEERVLVCLAAVRAVLQDAVGTRFHLTIA